MKIQHNDEIEAQEWEENLCIMCGRKVGSNPAMVHLVEGGEVVFSEAESGSRDYMPGDMGFWPVGNECAKKFAPGVLLAEKALLDLEVTA